MRHWTPGDQELETLDTRMFCSRDSPMAAISEGSWQVTDDMKWLHAEYRQRLSLLHSEEQEQRR